MVKVAFPFHVLHEGRLCAPHSVLEVTETEAKEFVKIGAKVIETSPEKLESVPAPKPTKPVVKRGK